MAEFVTGKPLKDCLHSILVNAKRELIIMSPYIALSDDIKKLLRRHINKEQLHIIIIFGKNEKQPTKSLSKEDFDFFSQFPFVSIIYVPNLHAKYYGNDRESVVTSMNLLESSINKNIEFGCYFSYKSNKPSIIPEDENVYEYVHMIIAHKTNNVIYIKRPCFTYDVNNYNRNKYIGSYILYNQYNSRGEYENKVQFTDFPPQLEYADNNNKYIYCGFCIGCGKEIHFDINQPYCPKCKTDWEKDGEKELRYEEFDHFTGELSCGNTCKKYPILKRNFKKANDIFGPFELNKNDNY